VEPKQIVNLKIILGLVERACVEAFCLHIISPEHLVFFMQTIVDKATYFPSFDSEPLIFVLAFKN